MSVAETWTESPRFEPMRIAGRKVEADGIVEVRYPYTNEVIGQVPSGDARHAKEAFEIAANYKPKLTRYERQQILQKTAELLVGRREYLLSYHRGCDHEWSRR